MDASNTSKNLVGIYGGFVKLRLPQAKNGRDFSEACKCDPIFIASASNSVFGLN